MCIHINIYATCSSNQGRAHGHASSTSLHACMSFLPLFYFATCRHISTGLVTLMSHLSIERPTIVDQNLTRWIVKQRTRTEQRKRKQSSERGPCIDAKQRSERVDHWLQSASYVSGFFFLTRICQRLAAEKAGRLLSLSLFPSVYSLLIEQIPY